MLKNMDKKYQKSITDVLQASDMSNFNFLQTETRTIKYHEPFLENGEPNPEYDSPNPYRHTMYLECSEVMNGNVPLSKSWVANNILIFTVFDGWLEEKYGLTEGESFRKHYQELEAVASAPLDTIALNCYRILKLIRNGIQHNFGSVDFDENGYHIAYTNKMGTDFLLEITKESTNQIYTIVLALIEERISGINRQYHTIGHYEGILLSYYKSVCDGIGILEDDITVSGTVKPMDVVNGLQLAAGVRCQVVNPVTVSEDEHYVTVTRYPAHADWEAVDYVICMDGKRYLMPEETGRIVMGVGKTLLDAEYNSTVTFLKSDITGRWRIA